MSSRSKRLVTLALNQCFKEKLADFRKNAINNKLINKEDDPDFVLENEEHYNSSDSDADDPGEIIERETEPNENKYDIVGNILSDLFDKVINVAETQEKQRFTKRGQIRKRKCFDTSPLERKKLKQM